MYLVKILCISGCGELNGLKYEFSLSYLLIVNLSMLVVVVAR